MKAKGTKCQTIESEQPPTANAARPTTGPVPLRSADGLSSYSQGINSNVNNYTYNRNNNYDGYNNYSGLFRNKETEEKSKK